MQALPPDYHDLISEDRRAFAVIATAYEDGTPINAPVWFLMDVRNENMLISTSRVSTKGKNLIDRPTKLSIVLMHEDNHLRYALIQGEVSGVEPATKTFRDRLYRKYTGKDSNAEPTPEQVVFVIKPTYVSVFDYG